MQLHVIIETREVTHKDPEFEESQEAQCLSELVQGMAGSVGKLESFDFPGA